MSLERARLAREMHDVVAHNVSLIAIQAGALSVTAVDPTVSEGFRIIRGLSIGTLEELRHTSGIPHGTGGADQCA